MLNCELRLQEVTRCHARQQKQNTCTNKFTMLTLLLYSYGKILGADVWRTDQQNKYFHRETLTDLLYRSTASSARRRLSVRRSLALWIFAFACRWLLNLLTSTARAPATQVPPASSPTVLLSGSAPWRSCFTVSMVRPKAEDAANYRRLTTARDASTGSVYLLGFNDSNERLGVDTVWLWILSGYVWSEHIGAFL